MTCEHCQLQLLPFVYDLLDPEDRVALAAHMERCPDCAAALKRAQMQQGMLAEAVKEERADIVFHAPAKAAPAASAPTVMMRRPPRRLVFLNRWAAAAAILFVLFSAAGVLGWSSWRQHSSDRAAAQEKLAKAKLELGQSQKGLDEKKGQTQKEMRAIQEQIDTLFNDWKREETRTRRVLEEKRVQIIVTGPQGAQSGGANNYIVEVRQNNTLPGNFDQSQNQKGTKGGQKENLPVEQGQQVPNLNARVINVRNQEVLYQQNLDMQKSQRANFDLPNTLPIKPGDDLAIEFQTQTPDGKFVLLRDNLKLVFPEYVTHLATDRPLYRPGDTIRFRSLTLERFSLKPAQEKFHLRYRILGPRNEEIYRKEAASQLIAEAKQGPIKGPGGKDLHGLGAGEFVLPADVADGLYTLIVSEVNDRFNAEKHTFVVRRPQPDRFTKELQFHRSSYGAGDQVKVQARIVPKKGPTPGFRNGIPVIVHVVVDGEPVVNHRPLVTDPDGRLEFEFAVPPQLPRGMGRVTLEIGGGAVQVGNLPGEQASRLPASRETLVRDIPLVVRDLVVDCYPEGGDLVAGAANRVYFQARTPANKPANIAGRILDEKDQEVARVETVTDAAEPGINQGLGVFTFAPIAGKRYKLIVDSPIGIERTVALPAVKDDGVVMTIPKGVVESEIDVILTSVNRPRELLVGVYCRGRMLDHLSVRANADQPARLRLRPALGVGGVYRVTVFEKTRMNDDMIYRPVAERLIYRKRAEKVNVEIAGAPGRYQPGETVRLALRATNEKKQFVPAVAMVAIVDRKVLTHANETTGRAMPTHFLLTTEVRNPEDLENADFLLGDHPKAAESLDLLLGCQGWRRFAEQDPLTFVRRQQRGQTPTFLANSANVVPQFLEADQRDIATLDQNFVKQAIELEKKLAATETHEEGPADLRLGVQSRAALVTRMNNEVAAAETRLGELRYFMIQFGLGGALLTLLFFGFFLVSVGLRRLSEGEGKPRVWLGFGLGLLGALFLISMVGTVAFMGENLLDREKIGPKADVAMPKPMNDPGLAVDFVNPPVEPLPPPEIDDFELAALQIDDAKKLRERPQAPRPLNLVQREQDAPAGNELGQLAVAQKAPGLIPRHVQEDRKLRQEGNYQALVLKQLGRRVRMPAVDDPCVVRVYAHRASRLADAARSDFAPTIFWHPALVMLDGKAEVGFDLSDSVTRFEVLVLSHTLDGRLGANRIDLTSQLPFRFEPRTPLEVSDKDEIAVPVELSNVTSKPINATLSAGGKGLTITDEPKREMKLKGNERTRELVHVKPALNAGDATLRVVGATDGYRSAVERHLKVVPDGFPVTGSVSGVIENGSVEPTIELPAAWIPGTLKVEARFYPSPLAELASALDALAREPAGCFEQASSQNFSNTLMLQHLSQTKQSNPKLETQARQALLSGYRQMADFECVDPTRAAGKGGYAWFGQKSPDEALTAYGLLQLRDLAKLRPFTDDVLQRNQRFLVDRVAKKSDATANAYVAWALTEIGAKEGLDREIAAVSADAKKRHDPYLLALAGLSLLQMKKNPEATELLQALSTLQQKDGRITGARTSITGSQGRDLDVETTALAILAWLRADRAGEYSQNVHGAMRWLGQQRQGAGTFGGTQATVLALKAMIAYHHKNPQNLQPGEATLSVPQANPARVRAKQFEVLDARQKKRVAFSSRSQDPIVIAADDSAALNPGRNSVQLNVSGSNIMPYTLTWSYRTQQAANDPKAPIQLAAKLDKAEAREGDTIKLTASVENVSGKLQGMTVAILGLPAGLSLPQDAAQLKALASLRDNGKTPGKIAAWELRGRELVLYWRDLAAGAKVQIELDLNCQLPGVYRGPASRAYVYYDAEHKCWIESLAVRVTAK